MTTRATWGSTWLVRRPRDREKTLDQGLYYIFHWKGETRMGKGDWLVSKISASFGA